MSFVIQFPDFFMENVIIIVCIMNMPKTFQYMDQFFARISIQQ
jgi:hypothetical protein